MEFEYEEWPMLYAAVKDQADRHMDLAENADDKEQYYCSLSAAEAYLALLAKITQMATEHFPALDN